MALCDTSLGEVVVAKHLNRLSDACLQKSRSVDELLDFIVRHFEEHARDVPLFLEVGVFLAEEAPHKRVEKIAEAIDLRLLSSFICLGLLLSSLRSRFLSLVFAELGEVGLRHDARTNLDGCHHWLGWLGHVLCSEMRHIQLHLPKVVAGTSGDVDSALVLEPFVEGVGAASRLEVLVWMNEENVKLNTCFVRGRRLADGLHELASHRLVECVLHNFGRVEEHRARDANHRVGDLD